MKFDCIEGECIILVQILKGEFRTEDYDFCVAHSDMEKALVPLKSVLKSRYRHGTMVSRFAWHYQLC